MKTNLKELFFQFLEEKKCLEEYLRNFHKDEVQPLYDVQSLIQFEPESCIDGAFTWILTPEGMDYWESINSDWENLLNATVKRTKLRNPDRV